MGLGKRLVQLRKANDITQEELGRQIGVGKTTISNYETGYSSPDSETLVKLADYFNVSIDYLLGYSDNTANALTKEKLEDLPIEFIKENFIKTNNPVAMLFKHTGIAEKLTYLRKKNNISIKELTEKLNAQLPSNAKINISTIESWEGNLSIPYVDDLRAISELYEVSINYLITSSATSTSSSYKIILESPPSLHDILTHLYLKNKINKMQYYEILYKTRDISVLPYSITKNSAKELKHLDYSKYGIKQKELDKAETTLLKMREDSINSLQIIEKQIRWEMLHKWEPLITLAENYNISPKDLINCIKNKKPEE